MYVTAHSGEDLAWTEPWAAVRTVYCKAHCSESAVGGDASSIAREFVFVPYGDPAPRDRASLSCDGKVDGATLDLTHWTNNITPEALYADTSTEIALNLARARFCSLRVWALSASSSSRATRDAYLEA